ncbi:MAG: xanthine dehydrogenase family protein subunit M [Alphaproteobacteria bacterium]|nr:xanthine dehydrogenase family protein subunit M [Alphaproteobacteria bacterium]
MKAAAFDYTRVTSVEEAIDLLRQHAGSAQLLAGGQSLMAMMNLRLAQPGLLIDISGIADLKTTQVHGSVLRIGALVTHHALLKSDLVARHVPLLAQAVPHVAHLAIRNVGTIGGSLALADPAAEYPAVALALEATIVAQGPRGQRLIPIADYFQGLYQTALQPDEMLVAVEFPLANTEQRFHFDELSRRRGDYAMVGLACAVHMNGSKIKEARLAYLAMGDGPVLATRAMSALQGQALDAASIQKAQQALAQDLSPNGDLQADPATKVHLARVLLGRALNAMGSAS